MRIMADLEADMGTSKGNTGGFVKKDCGRRT